jgi:hypothetical protein
MDLWKKRRPAGGENVTFSIRYRGENTAQEWAEFATARIVPREIHTTPTLPLQSIAVPVALSAKRMKRIAGKADGAQELIDYTGEKAEAGKDCMTDHLARSVWSDGTDETNDYGDRLCNLTGLKAVLARGSSYASISPTDAPEWNPAQIDFATAASGAWAGYTISGSNSLSDIIDTSDPLYLGNVMDSMIAQTEFDGESTNLIMADIKGYELILKMLHPTQRQNSDIGYGSFKGVFWQGIPVVRERNATFLGTGATKANIVGLNTKLFEIACVPGAEIAFENFEKVKGTDAVLGMYLFDGQMICRSRRNQWSIINAPTA